MVLKIYFGVVLLFFVLLLAEWAKRNDRVPFWVVVVGALFWPLTLGVVLEDILARR
jgi:hypothetical protein